MKKIRIIALMILSIALIIFMDMTYNYFNASFTDLHDGIIMSGVFGRLFYGDSNWTLIRFFNGFITSLRIVIILGIGNIVLTCIDMFYHQHKGVLK